MGQTSPRVEQRPCDNQCTIHVFWVKTCLIYYCYRLAEETLKLHRPVHSTCSQRAHVFLAQSNFLIVNKGPGNSNAIIIIIQSLLSVTVKHCYGFENTTFGYSMATFQANEIQQVLSTSMLTYMSQKCTIILEVYK